MLGLERKATRTWGVQELAFKRKNGGKIYNSVEKFFKEYEQGAQITVFVMRTDYTGIANSDRVYEYGAEKELFTVQKHKYPITEEQIKMLERMSKPSCGNPNYGRTKI